MTSGVQIVFGLGEVGSAIQSVLRAGGHTVYGVDPWKAIDELPDGDLDVQAIHICFPYSSSFVREITAYEDIFRPDLVIVHSTVKPGTCDPHGWVHSPVQGKHPRLAESMTRFDKWFGGRRADQAAVLFEGADVFAQVFPDALTCELAKVLDTTRYGWEIVWVKEVAAICKAYGVDVVDVHDLWTYNYNAGYRDLGYSDFTRSVLNPVPGPIGGHCVMPNLELLGDWPVTIIINSFNDIYEGESA